MITDSNLLDQVGIIDMRIYVIPWRLIDMPVMPLDIELSISSPLATLFAMIAVGIAQLTIITYNN
jgi:hypothetical protein